MRVDEIMTTDVVTVGLTASASDAARKMHEADVGTVLVVDDGTLRGLITDRKIVTDVISQGNDPTKTKVESFMTRDLYTLRPQDDILDALMTVEERQFRRYPVVDEHDHLLGIVSISDLAGFAKEAVVAILDEVSKQTKP